MMPQVVRVNVRSGQNTSDGSRRVRLWIPVLPVLLLLSPLLPLVLVVLVVAFAAYRVYPVRTLVAFGRLFCAARGTRIEIDQPGVAVLVDIR